MVIKYETCSYSGYKIAPGHGLRYCEVNGKSHLFINKKNHRLFLHGKKPLNIRWNIKWRNAHKIGKVEESFRDTKQADAQRYKYVQEIKEKRKKYLDKVRKNKGDKVQHKDKAIKNVKGAQAGKRY